MIKKRINQTLRVVALSCEQELLEKLSYDEMQKYQMSRDISVLPLNGLKEPATIFTICPLLPEYEYLLGSVKAGNYNMIREFVRMHCVSIEGFDAEFEEKKGRNVLSRKSVDELPLPVIEELATLIEEGTTRGQDIPFSLQDSITEAKKQVEIKNLFA